jgi:hypothetical protein
VFEFVVAWSFAIGGLLMAVGCALNCLGLARGWIRNDAGTIGNLGLGMMSAGLAGFLWAMPLKDGPVEAWRYYWMLFGAIGLVLMIGVEVLRSGRSSELAVHWHWWRQGARFYTSRSEWRPRHFVIVGIVAAAFLALGFVPQDSWWLWLACPPFFALTGTLKNLPIHFGRRPPKPLGPATEQ